jgi:hypothetical protein
MVYGEKPPKLVSPVAIPRAVATEVKAGPAEDAAVLFLAQPSWLSVVDLTPALSPLAVWHLGQGESEVLEYARSFAAVPARCLLAGTVPTLSDLCSIVRH